MRKLTLLKGANIPHVVTDEKGKPVRAKVKWRGVEREIDFHENKLHKAGEVVEVSDELAEELLAKKAARPVVREIDEDI
jgi:hypothetical protein